MVSSVCLVITVQATPALGPAHIPKSGSLVKVTAAWGWPLILTILLRMRNISDNSCRKKKKEKRKKKNHFALIHIFIRKCGRYGGAQMTIWRMRICMMGTEGYKHTLRICNTYCFSTATMFELTPLYVMLYVHCLSCQVPDDLRFIVHKADEEKTIMF
jgi:hypothetical protein